MAKDKISEMFSIGELESLSRIVELAYKELEHRKIEGAVDADSSAEFFRMASRVGAEAKRLREEMQQKLEEAKAGDAK